MAKQSIPDNEGVFLDKPIQYIKILGHLNYGLSLGVNDEKTAIITI